MAFTDSEIVEHTALIEECLWSRRRPPLHLRDKMREGQRFTGHAIEFFFVRPRFDQPDQTVEESLAKVQFVRSRGVWRLYWKRADGQWHGYQPFPEARSLADVLRVVDQDAHACFFG